MRNVQGRIQNAERRTVQYLHFAFCNFQFAIFNFTLGFCILYAGVFAVPVFAEDQKKVLIPFDFVSKFDDGRYGQMIAEAIWKKLNKEGGFTLPESMQDVRDYCQSHKIEISPDMPLEKIKDIVKDDFGGDIGVWGSVERAPDAETDIYDLSIKCVDFSAVPDPKVIYETKSRTKTVSEIPHLYVKQMLDALYRRPGGGSPSTVAVAEAEANWKKNPNLIVGGDFQSGAGGVPKGWESVGGQQREPLGKLVRWIDEEGKPGNKIIRFTFDSSVGDNEGVMYYSDYFPVDEGAKYRFQCRWRTSGPKVKAFIKCYDDMQSTYKPDAGKPAGSPTTPPASPPPPGKSQNAPAPVERREVYRSQQNLNGPKDAWNTHTEDFTPGHTKYSPKWGRVMLYAYLGGGTVDFDDVVLKQIAPPPADLKKDPKPSQGSNVTVKEMEENERRSRESKEKAKPRP